MHPESSKHPMTLLSEKTRIETRSCLADRKSNRGKKSFCVKTVKFFMAATAGSDPYYVARDAVNQSVIEIQGSIIKWEAFLTDDSSGSRAFSDLSKALLEDVDRLEEDLSVIDGSIRVVESNPSRFPLRHGELETRKQWAANQHRVCSEVRSKVNGPQAKARAEADKRRAAALLSEQSRQKREADEKNSVSIDSSKLVHEQIIQHQDDTLTELARVTDRLGQTALVINTEIQDQQRLLSELDRSVDRQKEKMNYVMGKMAKLLKTSDTKQLLSVIVLMVVAVILFMWNISL